MARRYKIPTNFQEPGYAFNGMIAYRNLADAAVLAGIGLMIASCLPIEGYSKLSAYILFAGIFGLIGVTGIQGVPFSTYLSDIYRWSKRRKPYLYNSHGGLYTVSSADVLLNEPQLRDTLADAIDSMKVAMQKGQQEYIEGETFEFEDDPELIALKDAEDRIAEEEAERKAAEEEGKKESSKDNNQATMPAAQTKPLSPNLHINVKDIISNMTQTDLDEGGDGNA